MDIAAWRYQEEMNSNHMFGDTVSWKQDFPQWKDLLPILWIEKVPPDARQPEKPKNVHPEYWQALYWMMPGIEF